MMALRSTETRRCANGIFFGGKKRTKKSVQMWGCQVYLWADKSELRWGWISLLHWRHSDTLSFWLSREAGKCSNSQRWSTPAPLHLPPFASRRHMTNFVRWREIVLTTAERGKKNKINKTDEWVRYFQSRSRKFSLEKKNGKCIGLWQVPSSECDLCTFQNRFTLSCLCTGSPETFIHQSRRPVGAGKKRWLSSWRLEGFFSLSKK